MACKPDYIEFLMDRLRDCGEIRFRKMFGDYCIYIDEKPLILVCDNIAYVKKVKEIEDWMQEAESGCPYDGAKEHWILDVEHPGSLRNIMRALWEVTPYPKKKKRT